MLNSIGVKIAALRKEAGLTQQQMSDQVGISRPALVKIENNQRAISLEEGEAISKILRIRLETLLEMDEEQEEKTFAMAFKVKGMEKKTIDEIAKYELLFDAFIAQEQIYNGE